MRIGRTFFQLRLLKTLRLVKLRREGKIAYYSLDDTHISELIEAINVALVRDVALDTANCPIKGLADKSLQGDAQSGIFRYLSPVEPGHS